jgi:phosphate-selective porin OprO/OprP
MKNMIHPRRLALPAALSLLAATGMTFSPIALAGDISASEPGKQIVAATTEKPLCDQLWDLATIYKNEESNYFNEFRLTGRMHLDAYSIDSDQGYDQDWIVRRTRAGAVARFFHKLEAKIEVDFNLQNPRPAYSRLTEANLSWKFDDALRLTVGKQSVKFTLDGSTSSNELITIDRNNLSNNLWFTQEYVSGIGVDGKVGAWQYRGGYFSGGTDTKEFGNFDEGHFGLLSIGYDFGKTIGVKKAVLRADYVYNDRNPKSNATRPFENIGALVFQLDDGRWGFSADLDGGTGYGTQSDVWGLTLMPWFYLTKQLQVVARYNYIESEDPRGVRLNRYDTFVSTRRGDEYHEIYGGLNYYICGQRLKVQTGVSYVSLDDSSIKNGEYHAWQWTSGLRFWF